MKKLPAILLLATALLCAGPANSRSEASEDVVGIAQDYFAALLRGDYGAMAHLSSGAILRRVGGEAKLAELYRSAYGRQSERLLRRESVTKVTWFDSGVSKVYVVETLREYESYPRPMSIPFVYAVSPTTDGDLRVLDLSCLSVDWLDELAPGFRNSGLAQDLVARGVVHPAEDEPLD